jgi:hypothetical protein
MGGYLSVISVRFAPGSRHLHQSSVDVSDRPLADMAHLHVTRSRAKYMPELTRPRFAEIVCEGKVEPRRS